MLAAVAVLLAAGGCETNESIGGLFPNCISFLPEADPVPAPEVATSQSPESSCDVVHVDLSIADVDLYDSVFGIKFEVDYPFGIASALDPVSIGSFLGSDGTPLIAIVTESPPGHLEVSLTREDISNGGADPITDDDRLLALRFLRQVSTSSGPLTFSDAALFVLTDPNGPPDEVPVEIQGGMLAVD